VQQVSELQQQLQQHQHALQQRGAEVQELQQQLQQQQHALQQQQERGAEAGV